MFSALSSNIQPLFTHYVSKLTVKLRTIPHAESRQVERDRADAISDGKIPLVFARELLQGSEDLPQSSDILLGILGLRYADGDASVWW